MAEEILGGLAAAAEQPAQAPVQIAQAPVAISGMEDLAKSRANLIAVQQKLMEQLEERSKPKDFDFWASLAKGFSNPDAKYFSQGAGAAVGELQRTNELQSAKDIQVAQMRMAVAQNMLEQQKKLAAMDMLSKMSGAAQPGQVSRQAAVPAEEDVTSAGSFRNITGADIARLSMFDADIAKAIENGIKLDQDRFKISQNGIIFDARNGQYLNIRIPGQTQSDYTTPYGTFKMTPYDFSQYQDAQKRGKGREWLEQYRSGGSGAIGAPSAVPQTGMLTEEEKAEQAARKKIRGEAEEKYSAGVREGIFTAAESAPKLSSLAQSNLQIVKDNPDAVGVLAAPGIGNAILGMISKARLSSGTTGGSADIDTSGIEEAIKKIGPKRMANESDADYAARKQRNIDASLQIVRNLAEMELTFARSYLKGQGTVTDMERRIVKALGGSPSDSKNALFAKNELLIKTADYDEKIKDAYIDWSRKNPNSGAEMFKGSAEEKALRKEYDDAVKALNSKYFAAPKSSQQGGNLQELRDRLRQQLGQ